MIESLGKPATGVEISVDDVESLARDAVANAIKYRDDVLTAYWGQLEPDLRYRTDLSEARVMGIRQQRRYERGDEAMTLVDADWQLNIHPAFQDVETDEPALWSRFSDPTELEARIQLFVRESGGDRIDVEFITGRWWSRTKMYRQPSGAFMTIRELDPREAWQRPADEGQTGEDPG